MNFTVYVGERDQDNIWLSEDNQIRVRAPSTYLVPSKPQWEVRLNDFVVSGTLEDPSPTLDIRWFSTMMQVILFLLDYCGGDIHFTYERINGTDGSGIDRMKTTWSKKKISLRGLYLGQISPGANCSYHEV